MNHVSDILKLASEAFRDGIEAVLATVVRTEGSAYRKEGAMMLICADGRSVGMISGGCLEPHIIKRAFWITRNGPSVQVYQTGEDDNAHQNNANQHNQNNVESNENSDVNAGQYRDLDGQFDSLNDDDIDLNFGLGCNGRVHVLFERLASAMPLIKCIKEVRNNEQTMRIATLIRSDDPSHLIGVHINLDDFMAHSKITILNEDLSHISSDPTLIHAIKTLSSKGSENNSLAAYDYYKKQASKKQAQFGSVKGVVDNNLDHIIETQWLVRHLQPQIKLLICGAGNDVLPLVTLAKMQDWHVTVLDSRAHYATRARFMQADSILCLPLEDSDTLINLSRNAAVAVMSHSLSQDRARLKVLLTNPPVYLGQLGPKYRTERLISEIKDTYQGDISHLQQGISQLHYPIGYKLGGDGPEALALGIIAQINAVMHGVDLMTLEDAASFEDPLKSKSKDSSKESSGLLEKESNASVPVSSFAVNQTVSL